MQQIKRSYKDGVFRQLFNDKEKLIELYNALSGRSYSKDTEIEIVTLEDALFGDIKNDLSFIMDNRFIVMIEHQATVNPNMPLRMLSYAAREYERRGLTKKVYSRRRIEIPTPELYMLYNGAEDQPIMQELKLSDAYIAKCGKISLEARVKVINVNYDKGADILKRCKTLNEYSMFIHMIREKQQEKGLQKAVEESVRECMRKGILTEFLERNGGDIVSLVRIELTREECEAIREEDGYVRGLEDGLNEGRIEEQLKIARNMKALGAETAFISKASGLTKEEVDVL
ncbi:hypothetical protein [Gallibacter sp. Marseille-QA0791]|uniref:hypothetical protein n=1 Tax=Gallibacter sp. Marseille-QA0791 TaxID=3378781 RepID=UPI002E9E6CD8|nr:hypothetical protein [Anaerovoracaceae bacterium]